MKKSLIILLFVLIIVLTGMMPLSVKAYELGIYIVEGNVETEIVNNNVIVYYNNNHIEIPSYDVYFFNNSDVTKSYFIADVIKCSNVNSKITCLVLYYNEIQQKYSKLNIQIYEEDSNIYYNLIANITDDEISIITDEFIQKNEQTSKEVTDRIKTSLSIFNQIQHELINSDKTNSINSRLIVDPNISPDLSFIQIDDRVGSGTTTSNSNSISSGSLTNYETDAKSYNSYGVDYDNYTNSDGIIHDYVNYYFGNYKTTDNDITDDPIINIIPKELCFTLGKHFYIGKEYGFYISTTIDSINTNDYCVDIFIFDILNDKPNFADEVYEGTLRVTPLFQYRYRAIDRSKRNDLWDGYDPALTKIVYPHLHYDVPNYKLNNVSFKHSVENEININYGETVYQPNEDNGAFIIQTRFNYSGTGLLKYKGNFTRDIISYLFGFVDQTKGTLSYLVNMIQYDTYEEIKESNNEENINTSATNRYYQIESYGQLIKQVWIKQNNEAEKPVVYGINNYIESKYVVSYYNEVIPTRFINSIYAEIGVDNTDYYLWGVIKTGSFDILATANSYYSSSKEGTMNDSTETISSLDYEGDAVYYEFSPQMSGNYIFETTGNTDTVIKLYKKDGTFLDEADDEGEGKNARLGYELIKGEKYVIKVAGWNDNRTGDFRFLIMYNIYDCDVLYTNSDVNVNIKNPYEMKVIKFIPKVNSTYTIVTKNNTGDPKLTLYDENMMELISDDDGGKDLNSQIVINLEANKIYYILARCYSNNTGIFTIEVSND